jgi:hypothetical protein
MIVALVAIQASAELAKSHRWSFGWLSEPDIDKSAISKTALPREAIPYTC